MLNLERIAEFAQDELTYEKLVALGLVRKRNALVKVLGVGELTVAVTVHAHKFSKSAQEKIEKGRWESNTDRRVRQAGVACWKSSLNIFRIPDLRKRVLFTLFILAIYGWVPCPYAGKSTQAAGAVLRAEQQQFPGSD